MTTNQPTHDPDTIHRAVQDSYTRVVQAAQGCCGGSAVREQSRSAARAVGYSDQELAVIPADANLGLGCGNPTAIDTLKPGETVLDLGCGAGMDVFLAARKVGPTGLVIGVDMTEAMITRARANAARSGVSNVEFRQGLIEELPVESGSIDAIISNCVVNLAPDKARVYREAYRVLKPGGRLMISDIVVEAPLPAQVKGALAAWTGCVAGAMLKADYLATIREAGFAEVEVATESGFGGAISFDDPQVRALMAEFGISDELARKTLPSVKSIGVVARKLVP